MNCSGEDASDDKGCPRVDLKSFFDPFFWMWCWVHNLGTKQIPDWQTNILRLNLCLDLCRMDGRNQGRKIAIWGGLAQFKGASVHPHCYLHYLACIYSVCFLQSMGRSFNFNVLMKIFILFSGFLYNIDICLLESGVTRVQHRHWESSSKYPLIWPDFWEVKIQGTMIWKFSISELIEHKTPESQTDKDYITFH